MFAAQHKLDNLHVIVDLNGQQALALTRDVINQSNLAEQWRSFGWQTSEVDGHSVPDLVQALSMPGRGYPHVLLARTVFGKGVDFMEQGMPLSQKHLAQSPVNWHYLPMSDSEYKIALEQVEHSL